MELLFTGRKIRMNIWNKIFKRELFVGENKILYNENIFHGEDVAFLYDVFSRVEKVCFVPLKYYAYTKRKGSLVNSKMNVKKLTYLHAVDYSAKSCKEQLPEAYAHVAGWQAGVNVETFYYMWRDKFYDYDAYQSVRNTFKTKMPILKTAQKHHVIVRLFAPVGASALTILYKMRFGKRIKQEEKARNEK